MDKISQDKARKLIEKYLRGECTEKEKAQVEQWYASIGEGEKLPRDEEDALQDVLELQDRLGVITSVPKRRTYLKRLATAAVFVFCILGAALIWKNQQKKQRIQESMLLAEHIMPASHQVSLTLEGDTTIALDERQGIIMQGSTITYADGTAIQTVAAARHATLQTGKGGQYYAVLPDGSEVWLNAESSVQYPTSFARDHRTINVTGEVFIQVAKMPNKPFYVHVEQQQIEVLGTGFNINAYADKGWYETTLVEGRIKLMDKKSNESVVMKPGQQALLTPTGKIRVANVDIDEYTSWKEGVYLINNQSLEQIAKYLERWYDIEVEIGKYSNKKLSVIVRNDVKLSEILNAIHLKTGVKFLIEGRRVLAID